MAVGLFLALSAAGQHHWDLVVAGSVIAAANIFLLHARGNARRSGD